MEPTPPPPSALPTPSFGARAAAPAASVAVLRERLAQLITPGGPAIDGVSLNDAYQRTFRAPLAPREYGVPNLRQLLLRHGASVGLSVETRGAGLGNVWVTLAGAAPPAAAPAAPSSAPAAKVAPPPAPMAVAAEIDGPYLRFVHDGHVASSSEEEDEPMEADQAEHAGSSAMAVDTGVDAGDPSALEGSDGRVRRDALLQQGMGAAPAAALDAARSVGFQMLRRMGWEEGRGLGPDEAGRVDPVSAGLAPQFEGVGLGCEHVPEASIMTSNIEQRIQELVRDSTRTELEFDAELSPSDRKLVHQLAQKHGLLHRSRGKGEKRFITVAKPGAKRPMEEAEMEAHFDRVHELGYSRQNKGLGLGWGSQADAAAPPTGPVTGPVAGSVDGPTLAASEAPQRAPAAPQPPPIDQWASSVVGFSSQFSTGDNSARQLLGAPGTFPEAGTSTRAWSAVPRPGECTEWVRLGYRIPVKPTQVIVHETLNPGSVIEIRATADVRGRAGADSMWHTLWSGERTNHNPNRPAAHAFAPPLDAIACAELRHVAAIEVTLDTTGWSEDFWSELDAVKLVGSRPTAATAEPAAEPDRPFLTKQVFETDRAFAERCAYVKSRFGPPPADESEAMRHAALSMVYTNAKLLGCRYPAEVERAAGVAVKTAIDTVRWT